jgi:CubicO group peptidase (beta-lactamase class C family)
MMTGMTARRSVSSRARFSWRVLALASLGAIAAAACGGGGSSGVGLVESTVVVTDAAPVASTTTTTSTTTTLAATTAPPTTVAPIDAGVFPGADWEVGELPAEVDRQALDAAVDTAFGAPDAAARVRSIVIVQGGRIVYERYHPLDGPDTIMQSFSVAKSITSAAIGLLVGDGLVDVTARAPIAQWDDPADPRHAITLEHLLHMASGLQYEEQYGPGSQVLGMLSAPVASEFIASFPLEADPGTLFDYSTGTTAILAGMVYDALGGTAQGDAYLQDRLFEPLGMTTVELQRDQAGRWVGGFGADATTRDFARFGLLYVNDGVWDGERILPEGWVEYSRTPSPSNAQYGAQWWMFRDGAFEARGLFGQVVLVSPRNDLVMAINTTSGGDADTLLGAVYPMFDEME